MAKRHGPEDVDFDEYPMFPKPCSAIPVATDRLGSGAVLTVEHAHALDAKIKARARADLGIARAARRARRIDPASLAAAVDVVRDYATEHLTFLCEDVRPRCSLPDGADPRAFGHVMRAACRAGFIKPGDPARANSSNRSFKVEWRSLVVRGAPC